MSVGDINSTEKGSGARYNDGKPKFSLIPLVLLEGVARVWEHGTKKYSAWNWAKGADWDIPFDSLMRHLSAWQSGEDLDPLVHPVTGAIGSGLPHIDHMICNLLMLKHYSSYYKEGDTRPKEFFNDTN